MSKIVDVHSHVLPNIDDGSASVEESIALLRMEAEQGVEHVIATPHFYAKYDTPAHFLRKRTEAELRLREEMAKHAGLPELSVGAEVYFFPRMSDSEELLGLTFGNNRCIMLEMPNPPWTDTMYKELENIRFRLGLTPIIAHVDRYIRPFKTYGIPERLQKMPVLVQANASFFLHGTTRGMAMRMLKKDQIQLLGSDCHNLSSRKPNLGQAVQQIQRQLGTGILDQIDSYQSDVLKGYQQVF